ncbi:MAG: archaellin/type IV pilin N-terminal domain-containing protein [Candidatus Pacearchaeota archaeon]
MNKKIGQKKSLSPVIATVLLIAMVIVIGLIVFMWMRGSVKEVIYKFLDKNIELSCADVSFDVEYSNDGANGNLYVVNNGDVPIKDFKVQVITGGTKTSFNLNREGIIFDGIRSGNGENVDVNGQNIETADEILVIPILEGRTDAGTQKYYVCDERYGEKRYITSP